MPKNISLLDRARADFSPDMEMTPTLLIEKVTNWQGTCNLLFKTFAFEIVVAYDFDVLQTYFQKINNAYRQCGGIESRGCIHDNSYPTNV